ncbi:hypothetical protein FRC10_006103 [Ceratobasidium sp. 414]|nr:hypothetical protein FRC10_006103 [Ceratobasidium sp. 414]
MEVGHAIAGGALFLYPTDSTTSIRRGSMSANPKGATLIETVTRPIADGKPGDSPLDKITADDGFYRIVQYDEDGHEIDASFDATNPDLGIYGYSMVMSGAPQPAARTINQ